MLALQWSQFLLNRKIMNREIKFRAWDTDEGKMFYGVETGMDRGIWIHFDSVLNHDGMVVMQFSGLGDRKGRPIFEGDVLKGERTMWVCRYEAPCFRLYRTDGKFTTFSKKYMRNDLEVIGNIFENPELLPVPFQGDTNK